MSYKKPRNIEQDALGGLHKPKSEALVLQSRAEVEAESNQIRTPVKCRRSAQVWTSYQSDINGTVIKERQSA